MRPRILAAATLLSLAACSGDGPAESDANVVAPAPAGNESEPAGQTLSAIPEPFQGRWDFALDSCGDAASEGELTISGDSLEYYESVARVVGVTGQSPSAIAVQAEFSGEGQSWRERIGYALNADGDRLTTTAEDGSESVRMRCPS